MAPLNPDHLLEQAEHLIERRPDGGEPREVELRRAVSAAYYGVFHYILAAATDEFVGPQDRGSPIYTLVYRSIDHRALRNLCAEVKKPNASTKYSKYAPPVGFARDLQNFAGSVLDLQEKRHSADYDPSVSLGTRAARLAIATARRAIARFAEVSRAERQIFLALLLFPPR